VKKAVSRDLADLTGWLSRQYGREPHGYQFCAFCRPQQA
jgi:hypothetical protein